MELQDQIENLKEERLKMKKKIENQNLSATRNALTAKIDKEAQ